MEEQEEPLELERKGLRSFTQQTMDQDDHSPWLHIN